MRPEFAVTALPNGRTRMYVYEGASSIANPRRSRHADPPPFPQRRRGHRRAGLRRSLEQRIRPIPGYGTHNVCTGQCWYDDFVYTPAGHPDIVYVGGSYSYGERFSNKRGVVLSTDAGVSATDMTMDGTDPIHPNGLHPDQHALVTNPEQPVPVLRGERRRPDALERRVHRRLVLVRRPRPDRRRQLGRCRQLLSRVPTKLEGMNKGLSTLQFQSLSVSPFNVNLLQGGTQDNGTWQTPGNPVSGRTR